MRLFRGIVVCLLAGLLAGCTARSDAPDTASVPPMPQKVDAYEDGAPLVDVYVTEHERIETMPLETYLYGVLAGEMKNDWPMEALKAQAILARTFVLKFMAEKESRYEGADISTDIEEAQAYDASAVNQRVRDAVDATRGLVLSSGGELPYAWFHAHSGGVTALAREGLNWKAEEPPYTRVTKGNENQSAAPDAAAWEAEFSAVVADFGQLTEQGGRVTVYPEGLRGVKAVCYGGQELSRLEPGQRITGYARWQDAGRIHENDVTTFTSRGVFALLYVQGDVTEEAGSAGSLRWLPQRTARALREKIAAIWDDETTAAFVTAELTGDRGGLSVADETAMSQAGLSHLFAVSGLHCAFLVSLLGLLLGSRRRLSAGVSMAVLAFYMLVVGLSPSVVRACIMQAFVLAAPLFKRDSDGLTSLGAALLVILLANPFAAGSISLQLSFAATLGLVWLSPKLYRNLSRFYTGTSRAFRWAVNFLCANVSASVSALVFTIPLTAIYFNILTLTAPISNLLAVPAAGWNFMAGFVTVLAGFVCLPAARVLGWVCFGLVRYVLWVAGVLASAPGHAVYFSNGFLKYWLLYVYAMFGGCLLTRDRRRKYAVAGVLAAATLALAVGLNTGLHQYGDLSVMALDVGQGESVALYTREKAVLVDCGSSNSYISAGARAADQLESMGIHRLSAVAVTHYHADHTNGLEELLARMPVERLLLPEIQDEYGVRDRLLALARELDIPVTMVTDTYQFPMGQAMLTIYPPVGAGDLNEQGLTFLCSAGDFDALITGDMAGNTEKKLVERFDLPDIEVLVVGHHGSRYSSTDAFLQQVRPETAIISVGDNSYGHPTQEAMDRLSRNGAAVYRTDRQGNVLVTVNGGT